MLSDIKYFIIGLAIAIVIALLFATGMVVARPSLVFPTATPTQTNTPFPPTNTFTPQPSNTPTFTPTPTNIPPTQTPNPMQELINNGTLIFTGPLPNEKQITLYESSLKYIAPDPQNSIRISKQINGVGYGDPTNICGPLAIAIMRDAGLVTPSVDPHEFWLLNPVIPEDRRILDHTFPPEKYSYLKTDVPLNRVDWHAFPLQPGDFLFIWHGSGGNFDHMLVVNRVDSQMRAYAVTNYGTPNGFILNEVMLYDPNDPSVGIFHTWTQERDAILGSTGFGGFELWRLRTP